MKKLAILIFTASAIISCSFNNENSDNIKIRLSNVSQYDFQNIIVNTTTGNVSFNNVNAGKFSEYKVFATAYRYAYIELEIDGQIYTLQPIDYVGETPLGNGNYTYQIDATDSKDRFGRLSLALIIES